MTEKYYYVNQTPKNGLFSKLLMFSFDFVFFKYDGFEREFFTT